MRFTITLIALLASHFMMAQGINELEARNGFKDIKLGVHIDSIPGATFKKDIIERKEFEAKIYETEHPEFMTIGTVPVKKITLKTYKGLIYEIDVTTAKDPTVMRGLEKSFGKSTYSIRSESYYWKATSLSLIYKGHHKEIQLTYRSVPIINLMYTDKGKKIEQVADDF